MDEIRAFFQRDAFARHLGIELTEVSPGHAKATMPIRHHHANALGGLHGGAIFGLADFVFSAASNAHGSLSVAINVTISYLRPPEGNLLHAQAVELSRAHRLGSYTVRVTDDHQHLVAIFQGMVYIKGDPLPFPAPDEPATRSA